MRAWQLMENGASIGEVCSATGSIADQELDIVLVVHADARRVWKELLSIDTQFDDIGGCSGETVFAIAEFELGHFAVTVVVECEEIIHVGHGEGEREFDVVNLPGKQSAAQTRFMGARASDCEKGENINYFQAHAKRKNPARMNARGLCA